MTVNVRRVAEPRFPTKTGPTFTPTRTSTDRAGDDRTGRPQHAFLVVAERDRRTRRQDDLSAVGVHVAREPVHAELALGGCDTFCERLQPVVQRVGTVAFEQRVGVRELDERGGDAAVLARRAREDLLPLDRRNERRDTGIDHTTVDLRDRCGAGGDVAQDPPVAGRAAQTPGSSNAAVPAEQRI